MTLQVFFPARITLVEYAAELVVDWSTGLNFVVGLIWPKYVGFI